MTKNRNLSERGDNLLNPNVDVIKMEHCIECRAVIQAFESMREIRDKIDTSLFSKPEMFIHCHNGHKIDEDVIRKVLYPG